MQRIVIDQTVYFQPRPGLTAVVKGGHDIRRNRRNEEEWTDGKKKLNATYSTVVKERNGIFLPLPEAHNMPFILTYVG
jgi:hypothetical protein